MSLKLTILISILLYISPFGGMNIMGQTTDANWSKINQTYETLEKLHVRPVNPNDEWSENVFSTLIDLLDPNGLIFTQEDIDYLSKFKMEIDNYVLYGENNFLSVITEIYRIKLSVVDTIYSELAQNPLNFYENDTLFQYSGKIIFAKTRKDLKFRWKKNIKYKVISYLYTVKGENADLKNILANEPEAQNLILNKQKQRVKRLLSPQNGFENQMVENFLNAIALSFDPHSSFFSAFEKESFESDLSSEQYSYGFEIDDTESGELVISRLIPGGPAWRSNELHKGDLLLKASWGKTTNYDLTLMDEEEAEQLFETTESPKLELTVKKVNGQVKTVTLIKEKIATGENTIKSLLLRGQHDYGYIYLPGFYTEWDDKNPSGCANEMAREILKLRKENIEALIIDLRYNGGGSMTEALSLSGIFINEGPLAIVQNSSSKPAILKDFNRGSIYNEPLIILVNGYSASASEIVASTLQDYQRAIIVGSQTYGKATSQVIVPVENAQNKNKPLGYVKVTNGRIYRITGKSNQKLGVTPDIALPGYFEFGPRETDSPNSLDNDTITKKAIFTPEKTLPITQLKKASEERISKNPIFSEIIDFNKSVDSMLNQKKYILLNIKKFKNEDGEYYRRAQDLDSLTKKKSTVFKVLNNKYDKQVIDLDPFKSELNQILIDNVQSDVYVEECYYILNDLLNFKLNNN